MSIQSDGHATQSCNASIDDENKETDDGIYEGRDDG